jgi:hypothetical protein
MKSDVYLLQDGIRSVSFTYNWGIKFINRIEYILKNLVGELIEALHNWVYSSQSQNRGAYALRELQILNERKT